MRGCEVTFGGPWRDEGFHFKPPDPRRGAEGQRGGCRRGCRHSCGWSHETREADAGHGGRLEEQQAGRRRGRGGRGRRGGRRPVGIPRGARQVAPRVALRRRRRRGAARADPRAPDRRVQAQRPVVAPRGCGHRGVVRRESRAGRAGQAGEFPRRRRRRAGRRRASTESERATDEHRGATGHLLRRDG